MLCGFVYCGGGICGAHGILSWYGVLWIERANSSEHYSLYYGLLDVVLGLLGGLGVVESTFASYGHGRFFFFDFAIIVALIFCFKEFS